MTTYKINTIDGCEIFVDNELNVATTAEFGGIQADTVTVINLEVTGSSTVQDGSTNDFIEAGTIMFFYQASAPTGWTKIPALTSSAIAIGHTTDGVSGAFSVNSGTEPFRNHRHNFSHTHPFNHSHSASFAHDHGWNDNGGNPPTVQGRDIPQFADGTVLRSVQGAPGAVNPNFSNLTDIDTGSTSTQSSVTTGGASTNVSSDPDIKYFQVIKCSKD